MTNLGIVYPLRDSHIKICWAHGVVIISFRRWVVAPRGNSFGHSWGSQTTEDRGQAILPTTLTCSTLICCQLPRFEYNRSWGSYQEMMSSSLMPSMTSILEILKSDEWHPPCEFKAIWRAWPRGSTWSKRLHHIIIILLASMIKIAC